MRLDRASSRRDQTMDVEGDWIYIEEIDLFTSGRVGIENGSGGGVWRGGRRGARIVWWKGERGGGLRGREEGGRGAAVD